MKIAMLVFNQPERGTYWRAYYLARALCQRGHSVLLIATAPKHRWRFHLTYEQQGRLAIVEAPDWLGGSLRTGWDLWSVLARTAWLAMGGVDVIHAFECRPAVILPALATRRRTGAPIVIDWCDLFGKGGSVEERSNVVIRTLLRPIETFFETHFRRYANATTVINHTLARYALSVGVAPTSITLIPNGSNPVEGELELSESARLALGLSPDIPIIGYVGSIFAQDARLLAEAFNQVHRQRPEVQLLVIGYCNVAIEQLVDTPGAVKRTGPLSNEKVTQYLRACTLGWLPLCDSGANRGRWPLKINTYMEIGLPFVATAVGDIGPFIERYPVGVAVGPDADQLAQRTLELFTEPQLLAELGTLGRHLAQTAFNWATIADQVEQIYQELIA